MGASRIANDRVELRPTERGTFDELVLYDRDGETCVVHAEMMESGLLWIGLYPPGIPGDVRAVMWIRAKGSRLEVNAFED